MPTLEQVQQVLEVVVAGTVCLGAVGTALEAFGAKAGFPSLVKFGQVLEDFATNIPRLLGKEKPRA